MRALCPDDIGEHIRPANDLERAVKFYTEIFGMTIAKLNRDGMGDHLNRADLRSGDSMVVLFQRPKPVDRNALNEDGAPDGNLLQLYAPAKIPPES